MAFIIFVLVLSVLVFVHEYGHFIAARRLGIGVKEFGFGFPPKIWGVSRKGILYSINAIPFGGFVRLVGEGEGEESAPNSFIQANAGRKLIVLLAGVMMNILLAWFLISVALGVGVQVDPTTISENESQYVTDQQVVLFVSPNSPAAQSGLNNNDQILSINDQEFSDTQALITYSQENQYPPLNFRVKRDDQILTMTVTPKTPAQPEGPRYGLSLQSTAKLQYPAPLAPIESIRKTGNVIWQTVVGLGTIVRDLVVQQRVSDTIAGPVGIAVITSEVSQLGLVPLLQLMAILSISLAVINALPLPALDGGRVIFTIIEFVRRRAVNPNIERVIHSFGFIGLLLLIVVISFRDFHRFDVWDRILNVFQ